MQRNFRWAVMILLGVTALAMIGQNPRYGQAEDGYLLPPREIVDLLDAPPPPRVSIGPDGGWIVVTQRQSMPGIEDLSRRMLRLAGGRIDPVANSRFSSTFDGEVWVRRLQGGESRKVELPANSKVASVRWSHLGDRFSVVTVNDSGSQLWLVKVDAPAEPVLWVSGLHRTNMEPRWMPDGVSVLCQVVPADRGDEPSPPRVPKGPNIQESDGLESPVRTFQDLLSNPYDEALYEYYATGQLAVVTESGGVETIGPPGMIANASVSPDGRYFLVTRLQRPFSYLHTAGSFPQRVDVWDRDGKTVWEMASFPLADNIPIEGVRTGPRSVNWRGNEDATLVWVEALDNGDPRQAAAHRDRLMMVSAPFDQAPTEVLKIQHRYAGLTELADPGIWVVTERDRDRRWTRTMMYSGAPTEQPPVVLVDRSLRDRYGDPGGMVGKSDDRGQDLVRQDGEWIYRSGQGASPVGNLPFLDRQNLRTLETERLWQCREGFYESLVEVLASSTEGKPTIVISRESPSEPPNMILIDLESGQETALTEFRDPQPQIRGIKKQLVKYQRADGVPLSATLYLPADHQPGTQLPLFVWAYPQEFSDASTAGQVSGSPWQFTRIQGSSHLALVTQGYAVMDNATMPVIGDPETMNDTFVEQIAAAAQAAIDHATALGVADPNRVGVGGHSYGAFMTANLLAHTDLFKAGVARSGAYNRTLTPFGFQAERRTFWEAPDVYLRVSPFSHAHRVNQPLLLIHGEADNNSGTFPIQSERMYQAVKGNGGTTRLVMLPHESHGYQARESILHTHAETIRWLDKYVKNAGGSTPQ